MQCMCHQLENQINFMGGLGGELAILGENILA